MALGAEEFLVVHNYMYVWVTGLLFSRQRYKNLSVLHEFIYIVIQIMLAEKMSPRFRKK